MRRALLTAGAVLAAAAVSLSAASQDGFRFRSSVELVNVTATVTDESGRFVSGLRKEDFVVFEDNTQQEISHFSNERVPVSLGILLDTSGSMTDEKMAYARAAIERFVSELLDPEDELFFVEFSTRARLRQDWTKDRRLIRSAVRNVAPTGGTAMYDAISDALPTASEGQHRKKALLVISDGNDTNSGISVDELRQEIRQSEVLVYALGVDGSSDTSRRGTPIVKPPVQLPIPLPFPFPGGGRRPARPQIVWSGGGGGANDRVNADALRRITDDTGGRTEIVRGFGDLDNATARIADELSRQYYFGYASTREKDGRWHTIRVEVRNRRLNVRARRGYVAD